MKRFLITILSIFLFTSCSDSELTSNKSGVLDGVKHGEIKQSFIPYSKTSGLDTIATQMYVQDNFLTSIGGNYFVVPDSNTVPLWIGRHKEVKSIANKSINYYSTYAHFGGAEWNDKSKYGISFGYRNVGWSSEYPSVWIGSEMVTSRSKTNGDFIVATRESSEDVEPNIKFKVTHDGYIKAWVGYVPKTKDDIVNKAYLDYRLPIPPNDGVYVLQSDRGIVNWVKK